MRASMRTALGFAATCALFSAAPAWADHHASAAAAAHETATAAAADEAQTPFVRPDVRAYLDNLKANPRPAITRELVTMIRQMPPEMIATMAAAGDMPVGDLGEVRDATMPGPGGDIRMRMYDPRPAAEREPGPVVVFYHGGAFIVGSIETHAGLSAEMARALDLPVVSVDYRLAPENPWPAAPDDAEAAARWIADNGAAFDREFTGLILSGDSAGGTLTLTASQDLTKKPASLPVIMQIPIYPASDRTRDYPSSEQFNLGYGLDTGSLPVDDFYKANKNSVRTSPLLGALAEQPPTVLITASLDPLRDEGRAYAAKLIESGVPTIYYEGEGLIHGFATFRTAIPSAQTDTLKFLEQAKVMLDQLTAEQDD